MKRILLLGGTGLLGHYLSRALVSYNIIVHGFNRECDIKFNILNTLEVINSINNIKPDIIINLIALTNVDECEINPHKAYLLNVKPVEILKLLKEKINFHFIQISTDQVYDGNGPHKEENITLTNYYAYSKYMAEIAARCMNSIILRTNFFGKSRLIHRSSFTDWLFQNLSKQNKTNLFTDISFSPLSMKTLAGFIEMVIENPIPGTFNLGSKNGLSKRDFAYVFAKAVNLSTNCFVDSKSEEIKLSAYRPKDMRMDVSHFESVFKVNLPDLVSEINTVKGEYII